MNDDRELKKLHALGLLALILTILAIIFSFQAFSSLNHLKMVEDKRFHAFRLTEQLRLTSDHQTMMARAYVATGEERFKENFYRILAIRDGLQPRPVNYYRAYWDFQLVGLQNWGNGKPQSWEELFVSADFTNREQDLLRNAKFESDSLAAMEERAFHAREGRFPDEDGSYTIEREPDRDLGLQLLYSPEYLQARARIMDFINRSFEQIDARTTPRIEQLASDLETQAALAITAFGALILLLLVHATIRNRLKETWISQMRVEIDHKTADLTERNRLYEKTINDLRETQRLLLESEKFSALGNLVSSATHEINTPLGIGMAASSQAHDALQKMRAEYSNDVLTSKNFHKYLGTIQKCISMVSANLDRASKLMGSFNQVSVDQSLDELRRLNLADYVHNTLLILQPKYRRSSIQLVEDVPDDLELLTEPGALSQVITNIVVNAYTHAFGEFGEGRILIHAEKQDENIVLTISDNGAGMSGEVSENIYQPFYTTRRTSGGTGLGMNIVHKLVTERLKGQIHCETAPGKGSRFIITLPDQQAV